VGFNLIQWRAVVGEGLVNIISAQPDVLRGGSGTRSGMPILFPFPNRIAGAKFEFGGQQYRLTPAKPGDPNAIHGFCAKAAWTDYAATGDNEVTARFRISRDAPRHLKEWPGDLELQVVFRLTDTALRMTSTVTNLSKKPVPCGLGFHTYYTSLGDVDMEQVEVGCSAANYWVLRKSIPTGEKAPVTANNDLRSAPTLAGRTLDDVLTGLRPFVPTSDGLVERASVQGTRARVAVRCDANFREIVVFTPPDRQSVAVEPYTCPTDAVHLAEAGQDVGWRVLQPEQEWQSVAELRVREV
jgi:aldose 1-epimerase